MTKYLFLLFAVCVLLPACNQSVPPVPPSNRQVVGPKGSTGVMKSWNQPTQAEGNAILGPLSNERR